MCALAGGHGLFTFFRMSGHAMACNSKDVGHVPSGSRLASGGPSRGFGRLRSGELVVGGRGETLRSWGWAGARQAGLAPSPPVGSSLLLPRPWAALLRLLLQAGVPSDALRALAGPPCGRDAALEAVVWAALPRGARDAWDAHPRRMGTTEDEVGHAPALKFPVSACRDGTVHLQHGT